VGWIDRTTLLPQTTVKEAIVQVKASEIAVLAGATLREALSRMLGQGFRSVPVVDDRMRLIGEVTLRDIEVVTAETETT
jgi:CBS domain-containing protein